MQPTVLDLTKTAMHTGTMEFCDNYEQKFPYNEQFLSSFGKSVEPYLHVALAQLDVTPISADLRNIWSSKGICVHDLCS